MGGTTAATMGGTFRRSGFAFDIWNTLLPDESSLVFRFAQLREQANEAPGLHQLAESGFGSALGEFKQVVLSA
jgi:hypothetical protein